MLCSKLYWGITINKWRNPSLFSVNEKEAEIHNVVAFWVNRYGLPYVYLKTGWMLLWEWTSSGSPIWSTVRKAALISRWNLLEMLKFQSYPQVDLLPWTPLNFRALWKSSTHEREVLCLGRHRPMAVLSGETAQLLWRELLTSNGVSSPDRCHFCCDSHLPHFTRLSWLYTFYAQQILLHGKYCRLLKNTTETNGWYSFMPPEFTRTH